MRLVSCHIENFGKFHDYAIDFSESLHVVCEENGWGKSTLAAFIKAMFYGFEGERKRSIEENERKRYKPWQGGVFGGQLVIEVQAKRYQISRIFKDKEANDEFELRAVETNLPSADYSEKIGEELFLINSESFARTVFIGQSACETSATDDINAKIGNLADDANDLNNFDSAYAKLTELLNAMTPNRVTGSLSKRKNEIAACERMINDGRGIADGIDAYQGQLLAEEEKYHSLKIQLKEAGEEQAKVSKLAADLAKKSEWERLKKAVSERDDELKTAVGAFHGTIPASEEIKKEIAL
jgi:predicted ATP-dependent endonuclease of OLD family